MRNKVFQVTDRMLMRRYYRKTVRFIKNLSGKLKRLAGTITLEEGLIIITCLGVTALLEAGCFFGIICLERYPETLCIIVFFYCLLYALIIYICARAYNGYWDRCKK